MLLELDFDSHPDLDAHPHLDPNPDPNLNIDPDLDINPNLDANPNQLIPIFLISVKLSSRNVGFNQVMETLSYFVLIYIMSLFSSLNNIDNIYRDFYRDRILSLPSQNISSDISSNILNRARYRISCLDLISREIPDLAHVYLQVLHL